MRSLVLVALALTVAVSTIACGKEAGTSGSANTTSPAETTSSESVPTQARLVIGYSGAIQSNPNNKAVEDGIKVQAEALGMDVVVTDANLDANKQLSDVDLLIQQGVSALVIWPLDPKGIQPALDRARAKNIPIIVQDTTEGGPYTTNFAVNNLESAEAAATFLAGLVDKGAKAASIEGIPQVQVLQARNAGFLQGAATAGLEIVAQQVNMKDSADGARPIVDAWKAKYGSL